MPSFQGTSYTFIPELCTKCCFSKERLDVVVKIHTIDICLMIIERRFFRHPAIEFKSVVRTVPIDRRLEMIDITLGFRLNSSVILPYVFKLFVGKSAVESVRAIILVCETCMPAYIHLVVLISSLIEEPCILEIGIEISCFTTAEPVTAAVAARDLVAQTVLYMAYYSPTLEIAKNRRRQTPLPRCPLQYA